MHVLGQLIDRKCALRRRDRQWVCAGGRIAVDQHGQRVEVAALPMLPLLSNPRVELSVGWQRKTVQKRPGVPAYSLGQRRKLTIPCRRCARLRKGHRIGINVGWVKRNDVALCEDDIWRW